MESLQSINTTVDGQNPALPIIRNIPEFPQFRVLRVMQDFVHQPYVSVLLHYL